MDIGKKDILIVKLIFLVVLLFSSVAMANSYVADLGFYTGKTVYSQNEQITLIGHLYITNYTDGGSIIFNRSGISGLLVNVSIINKDTNATNISYILNTSSDGSFLSKNSYNTTAVLISAPNSSGNYYIRANYTDANN